MMMVMIHGKGYGERGEGMEEEEKRRRMRKGRRKDG